MNIDNITKGEFYIFKGEKVPTGLDTAINSSNGKCIAWVYGETEEGKANSQLITEAFNTTTECGLSPAQLRQQNKELREALEEAHSFIISLDMNHGDIEILSKIEETLSKHPNK